MAIITDPKQIDELLTRGVDTVVEYERLKKALLSGEQLRIKLGIDPTSPNIHIGRAVQLLKLRAFQALGHKIVFIVGDFTAVIGDTSDKESERPMLSREEIEQNKTTYFEQAGKILDLTSVEMRHNSEWLEKLTYREIGEHADLFSVSDFISRDNIKKRLDSGKRVSLREVLYPLMQGYDSVAVEADVEIGGSDQWFNLLSGRPLQSYFGQTPQNIMTSKLISGLDGRKMSSSWGNTINLTDEPNDMYGKVMSLSDELLEEYFLSCTRVPLEEVEEITTSLKSGTLHPKEAKMRLAREIVGLYHSESDTLDAERAFTETFSEGGVPDELPQYVAEKGSLLIEVLVAAGVVESKSEARRLFEQGAIAYPEEKEKEAPTDESTIEEAVVVKVGKKRFLQIALK